VLAGILSDGRGWFRTSDLSRVKREDFGDCGPAKRLQNERFRPGAAEALAVRDAVDFRGLPWIWAAERVCCPMEPTRVGGRVRLGVDSLLALERAAPHEDRAT
jgi:hypothetical protein